MLITEAFAQTAPAASAGGADLLMSVLPFLLIFVVMYFLIIRPQRAAMKRRDELLKNIRRGDQVVTGGGVVGKVTKVTKTQAGMYQEVEVTPEVDFARLTEVLVVVAPPPAPDPDAGARRSPAPARGISVYR